MVVIGAGWIGAEVAASARQKGLEVALVELASVPLERVLGPEVGGSSRTPPRPRRRAASWAPASRRSRAATRSSASSSRRGDGVDVRLRRRRHRRIAACRARRGRPGSRSATASCVNERLETSVPGVFAAGDVANAFHPFFGGQLRVEHWANALHQPATAARAMLGKHAPTTACRTSSPTSTTSGWSTRATPRTGTRSSSAATRRPRVHRLLAEGGARPGGMNVNVWDVTEPDQGADHLAPQVDRDLRPGRAARSGERRTAARHSGGDAPQPQARRDRSRGRARADRRAPVGHDREPDRGEIVALHYPILLDDEADDLTALTHVGRPDERAARLRRRRDAADRRRDARLHLAELVHREATPAPTWRSRRALLRRPAGARGRGEPARAHEARRPSSSSPSTSHALSTRIRAADRRGNVGIRLPILRSSARSR